MTPRRRRSSRKLYGGERTPEQFEAFEDARTENAGSRGSRSLNNPSLPYFLAGREADCRPRSSGAARTRSVPVSAAELIAEALKNTDVKLTIFDQCGHRPEIEKSAEFIKLVREFLA